MAEQNEKVLERVRQELSKNAKLGSRELYEMARGWDQSVGEQTLQQFHARYVLPIKREQTAKAKGKQAGKAAGTGRRGRSTAAAAEKSAAPAAAPRGRRTRRAAAAPTAGEGGGADRDRVRAVLLEFARDFAKAESKTEIVQVMSRIDEYVDRIAPS